MSFIDDLAEAPGMVLWLTIGALFNIVIAVCWLCGWFGPLLAALNLGHDVRALAASTVVTAVAVTAVLALSLALFRWRAPRLFVSYTGATLQVAEQLERRLRESGVPTLFVSTEIRDPDEVVLRCVDAMRKADICIFVTGSQPSAWQAAEWFAAIVVDKLVVVINVGEDARRPRTSMSGYPTLAFHPDPVDGHLVASFASAMFGRWVELGRPLVGTMLFGVYFGALVLIVVQAVLEPLEGLFALLTWSGERLLSTARTVSSIESWGTLVAMVAWTAFLTFLTARSALERAAALRLVSRQNRTRATTREALLPLVKLSDHAQELMDVMVDPRETHSEIAV